MKRSIKALAIAAPVVTLSGWIVIQYKPASPNAASDGSMRVESDGAEPGRLRPLPAGPPMYAPGTFGDFVPPAQRVGDMMLEVVPDVAVPNREAHDFAGNVI